MASQEVLSLTQWGLYVWPWCDTTQAHEILLIKSTNKTKPHTDENKFSRTQANAHQILLLSEFRKHSESPTQYWPAKIHRLELL